MRNYTHIGFFGGSNLKILQIIGLGKEKGKYVPSATLRDQKHICIMIKNKPEGERSRTLRKRGVIGFGDPELCQKAHGRLFGHQIINTLQAL